MTARSVVAMLLFALAADAAAAQFDPAHTRFGFEVRTRWGTRVVGVFPRYAGHVATLDDDRAQVRVELDAGAVEIDGPARYSAIARGPKFFDAANHPRIVFESVPYPRELLARGGALRGRLTLHGTTREETFVLAPAACARPGRDCDVVAHGSVRRDDYGLDGLHLMLQNRVHFTLRVRLADDVP